MSLAAMAAVVPFESPVKARLFSPQSSIPHTTRLSLRHSLHVGYARARRALDDDASFPEREEVALQLRSLPPSQQHLCEALYESFAFMDEEVFEVVAPPGPLGIGLRSIGVVKHRRSIGVVKPGVLADAGVVQGCDLISVNGVSIDGMTDRECGLNSPLLLRACLPCALVCELAVCVSDLCA